MTIKKRNIGIIKGTLIALVILAAIIISLVKTEYVLYISLYISLNLIIFFYLKRKITDVTELNFILKIVILGFFVRFIIIIVTRAFPQLAISGDDGLYISEGTAIAKSWNDGNLADSFKYVAGAGNPFYEIYNAVVYFVFGFYPSAVKIINSFFGIMACVMIYQTVKKLFSVSAAKVSLLFSVFFPSLILWQTLNLKEAIVMFLFSLIVLNLVELKDNPKILKLCVSLVYIYLLYLIRSYVGIALGGVLCLYFFIVSKYPKLIKVSVAVLLIIISSFAVSRLSSVFSFKIDSFSFNELLNAINAKLVWLDTAVRRGDYSLSTSAVLQDIGYSNISELIKFLPFGLAYFLFAPLPWMISGTNILFFSVLENIIFYVLFIFFIYGVLFAFKQYKLITIFLLIILSGFILFYSVSMGNLGLAYRYKDMLMPIFIIFASAGLAKAHERFMKKNEVHTCAV